MGRLYLTAERRMLPITDGFLFESYFAANFALLACTLATACFLEEEITEELAGPKKGGARTAPPTAIRPEGAAQLALVGPPNSGKSSLHARLTGPPYHVVALVVEGGVAQTLELLDVDEGEVHAVDDAGARRTGGRRRDHEPALPSGRRDRGHPRHAADAGGRR